jgi:hypothetical protein
LKVRKFINDTPRGKKMSDFQNFIDGVYKDSQDLLSKFIKGNTAQYKQMAKDLFDYNNSDLQEWTKQLANNEMSIDEFKMLIKGNESLVKMDIITAKGLAKIEADKLQSALASLIVDNARKFFL